MQQNKTIIPPTLKQGDEIRIVAPARGRTTQITEERKQRAIRHLESLGLIVTFGKYVEEMNAFKTSSVEHRLEDLHDAFADQNVKAIMAMMGGTSSNQLLKGLDYSLIQKSPKMLFGMSDITALGNAIYAKTGLVAYQGAQFAILCAEQQVEYTLDYFKNIAMDSTRPVTIEAAKQYCDTRWGQEGKANEGMWSMNKGEAEGVAIGGNARTFNLLRGSEYAPTLDGAILLLEDNDKESIRAVENHLQALINQPDFHKVRGVIFGRFQEGTGMTRELLQECIDSKPELQHVPIIANADFGHTLPTFTFPIGGQVAMNANDTQPTIKIL